MDVPSHGLQGPWKQGTIPGLPTLQQGHIYRQFPYTVLLPRTLKTNLTAVFLPGKKNGGDPALPPWDLGTVNTCPWARLQGCFMSTADPQERSQSGLNPESAPR